MGQTITSPDATRIILTSSFDGRNANKYQGHVLKWPYLLWLNFNISLMAK